MSRDRIPALGAWNEERLQAARADLREMVGSDVWAAAHLAPKWLEPKAEEHVIRELWESRIGNVTHKQAAALQEVASLGRYNLWCPLPRVADIGDILLGLGVEYSKQRDAIRLNSGFLNRAILVRQIRDGKSFYATDKYAAEGYAKPILIRYLFDIIWDEDRQQEFAGAVTRLRYNGRIFASTVAALAKPNRDGATTWERWCDKWNDLAPVAEVLTAIRTELPPALAASMADRFSSHVSTCGDEGLSLPTIVASLEVLQDFKRGRGQLAVTEDDAVNRLSNLAERQLAANRWPAGLRRRLLWVLRRLNRLDDTALQDLAPLVLRPNSPAATADMLLVLELFGFATPNGRDLLREQVSSLDYVVDDIIRRPDVAEVRLGLLHLAGRALLARYISDEVSEDSLSRRLLAGMKIARVGELGRALAMCLRYDRQLAASLAGRLDVDSWSRITYRLGTPHEVAELLATLGRIRPDLAVRTLRRDGQAVDYELVETLGRTIVGGRDAVSASMLLRASARLEERSGSLESGFAQKLAAKLGLDFLTDRLRQDSRISVLGHLIEGYASAQSEILASVENAALEIVEQEMRSSGSERGPRLALILSESGALGESFIDKLRNRKIVTRRLILHRMSNTMEAGALAAYHEIGVLLCPFIEYEFAQWLSESGEEWSENRIFRNLASDGNVVNALRAAAAIRSTLMLAGEPQPGSRILQAFDRADKGRKPARKWIYRILDVPSANLPEALRLLYRLDDEVACWLVEKTLPRLMRIVTRSNALDFSGTLSAVAVISPDLAQRLIEHSNRTNATADALRDLLDESDPFQQSAALAGLRSAENRTYTIFIPPDGAYNLRERWHELIPTINNAGLLESMISFAAREGADQARQTARLPDAGRAASRISRRNLGDANGIARLVNVLGSLLPTALPMLVNHDDAAWLLWVSPLRSVSRLAETLADVDIMSAEQVASILSVRLDLVIEKARIRERVSYWLAAGWIAWTLRQFGQTVTLKEPTHHRVLQALDPLVALWATAWLDPVSWTATLREQAIEQLREVGEPPRRAWAAAAVLSTAAALRREQELLGPETDEGLCAWQHALNAGPEWGRVLVASAAPDTRLRNAFLEDWSPWGVARLHSMLTWTPYEWRRGFAAAARALAAMK